MEWTASAWYHLILLLYPSPCRSLISQEDRVPTNNEAETTVLIIPPVADLGLVLSSWPTVVPMGDTTKVGGRILLYFSKQWSPFSLQ